MTSRATKSFYYAALSLPMWVNGEVYRRFRQKKEPARVHLGCGQKNYIPGWINLDANFLTAKIDVWANLENRLPFRDNSVEKFYSFHVIEHLPDSSLAGHFKEMFRALIPGGAIRVGGPNIDSACAKFLQGDLKWFPEFPDARTSIGGRFANFLFCRNEHLTALTKSYLQEIASGAGFIDLRFCNPVKESAFFDQQVLAFEYEDDFEFPHSLMLEARKPA